MFRISPLWRKARSGKKKTTKLYAERGSERPRTRCADQKQIDFWDAVLAAFKDAKRPARSRKALRNRWSLLQHDVTKFVGVHAQAERNKQSGSNENDVLATAMELFKDSHDAEFEFLHCWLILKDCPKFTTPSYPRKRPSPLSCGIGDDGDGRRHPGQKRAKTLAQDEKLRFSEIQRLDRIAHAMEEKNKLLRFRVLLRLRDQLGFDQVDVTDILAAVRQGPQTQSHDEEQALDEALDEGEDVEFQESTVI